MGEQRYYPFGETRLTTGTIDTDRRFTGQREIIGGGVYHFGARFRAAPPRRSRVGYSPKLDRFLSADSIVPNPFNPQDLNRFSYVRNNPLRYTDPTGHMLCQVCDGEGGNLPAPNPPPPPPSPLPQPQPNPNPGGGGDYCDTHPGVCAPLPTPAPPPSPLPTPTPSPNPTVTPPVLPTVTSPGTPPASFTQSCTSTVCQGAQFVGGAILVVGGSGFIALGVAMIGFAVVETAVVTAIPSPIDDLLTLGHRAAAFVVGLVFIGVGIGAIAVGVGEIRDVLTP